MFFPSAIDLVGRVAVALADRAEANYTNHVQIDDSGGGHSGAAGIHTMLARIVVHIGPREVNLVWSLLRYSLDAI